MVGWTRRNRQARERYQRWRKWFDALPLEKQREVMRRQAEHDKQVTTVFLIIVVLLIVSALLCVKDPPKTAAPAEVPSGSSVHPMP